MMMGEMHEDRSWAWNVHCCRVDSCIGRNLLLGRSTGVLAHIMERNRLLSRLHRSALVQKPVVLEKLTSSTYVSADPNLCVLVARVQDSVSRIRSSSARQLERQIPHTPPSIDPPSGMHSKVVRGLLERSSFFLASASASGSTSVAIDALLSAFLWRVNM